MKLVTLVFLCADINVLNHKRITTLAKVFILLVCQKSYKLK